MMVSGRKIVAAVVVCGLMALAPLLYAQNDKVLNNKKFKDEVRDDLKPLIVPPKPDPLDWTNDEDEQQQTLDRGVEVTHIRFNHSYNIDNDDVNDAMWIRWCNGMPLHHENHTKSGEYSPADERNDPAAYIHQRTVRIQVRFESKQPDPQNPDQFVADTDMAKTRIRAEVEDGDDDPAQFLALQEREVMFENGTSKASRKDADGNWIDDGGYITFDVTGAFPAGFHSYRLKFKFILTGVWDSQIDPEGEIQHNLIDSLDSTNNTPLDTEFYETKELHIYSTMGTPASPWFDSFRTKPWISALAFTGFKAGAFGTTTLKDLADKVVEHLHGNHSYNGKSAKYDHVKGSQHYSSDGLAIYDGGVQTGYKGNFWATSYMKLAHGEEVNCYDQAWAVATFITIATEDKITPVRFGYPTDFGYIYQTTFVGGESANNPFYKHEKYQNQKVVDTNGTRVKIIVNGKEVYQRSLFGNHGVAKLDSGKVLDATIGPVKTDSDASASIAKYLEECRDDSTQAEKTITYDDKLDSNGDPITKSVTDGTDTWDVQVVIVG